MIIAICCTRNWYIHLVTELYALFKHNKVKKVYLFIEDDEIPYIKDKRIEFINVNNLKEYVLPTSPNYNTQYSKMSYLRCYFSKVLKEDKILYIDADALVIDDIQELWDIDLEDNVLIGVHEGGEWDKHLLTYGLNDTYINSGVLIMDLKKIREERLDDSMLYLLNNNKYWFPDQDVINLVCRNRIKYVSNMYNSTETTGFRDDAKIIHYIRGNKGWIKTSPRSEIWFSYHNKYIKEEGFMDNYKVRAKINFTDYLGKELIPTNEHYDRKAGVSEWWCDADRYEYLKSKNAVELIEIKKIEVVEDPIKEATEIKEPKKIKKTKKK